MLKKSSFNKWNSIIWLLLYTLLCVPTLSFSQKDTINMKSFDVVEEKNAPSYKSTKFDSTSISNSTDLANLLAENSTAFIKSYGSGSLATISMRGTGASHTKVQWNGVNLNSPMNGQIDFSLFPSFFFDNAETHHGASGLIDGNGALGGSVLISNTEHYHKGLSANINQTVGSFDTYITEIKGSYAKNNLFLETKLYNRLSENNFKYIDNSQQDNPLTEQNNANLKQYGLQQAIYKKFKNSSLGTRIWYFNSDRNLPKPIQVSTNDENQTDVAIRAFLEWKGLTKNLQYKISSGIIKNELTYINKLANINSKNNSYLIDNNINTKLYLKQNLTLTNNFNIRHENATAEGYNDKHSRFNNSWLLGLNKSIKRLNIDLFNRLIMVENQIEFFSPTAGLKYQILKNNLLAIKANHGINYNYPTFNDLFWNPGGNTTLLPEKAEMSEIGISAIKQFKKTIIHNEITSFYSEVDDWIIWQPTEFGYWSPSNLKKVENKGIEASSKITTQISKLKISNTINYAYTKTTNKKTNNSSDNSLNKQLIYVPYHKLNYTLNLKLKTYTLNYNYNYTGKRFTTSDNNWYLPANFNSNITIAKQFKMRGKTTILTSFKINNLLNQDYQPIAWRPAPRRNFLFSINLIFN